MYYEEIEELKRAMNKVIVDEGLVVPDRILIRQPSRGIRKKLGCCIKKRCRKTLTTKYTIIVNTLTTKYTPDPTGNGRYRNNKTGQTYKATYGVKIPINEIMNTAAHEIAHLKFWDHIPEHLSYTHHILTLLLNEVSWPKGTPHSD